MLIAVLKRKKLFFCCLITYFFVLCSCGQEAKTVENIVEENTHVHDNLFPVADAGNYLTTYEINTQLTFDGSGSFDHDKSDLTYDWKIESAPENSMASIESANTPISSFTPDKTGQYVINLTVFDGTDYSTPDKIMITVVDTGLPEPPESLTVYNGVAKETELTSNSWYNFQRPYFEWPESTDNGSGVKGYYVAFDTDPKPAIDNCTFITSPFYENSTSLLSGNSYYFSVWSVDNEDNISPKSPVSFEYRFDSVKPTTDTVVQIEHNYGDIQYDYRFYLRVNDYGDLYTWQLNKSWLIYYENVNAYHEPEWQNPMYSSLDVNSDLKIYGVVDSPHESVLWLKSNKGLLGLEGIGKTGPQLKVKEIGIGRLPTSRFVTFADIDNDGDRDYFVNSENMSNSNFKKYRGFVFFENRSNEEVLSLGEWPDFKNDFGNIDVSDQEFFTFFDIDYDGDNDLFTITNSGNIRYYENTGTMNSYKWEPYVSGFLTIPDCTSLMFKRPQDQLYIVDVYVGLTDGTISKYRYPQLANQMLGNNWLEKIKNNQFIRARYTGVALYGRDDTGVSSYFISESSALPEDGIPWQPFDEIKALNTKEVNYYFIGNDDDEVADGVKTIYIWYKDVAGNISEPISDTIIKDSIAEPPLNIKAYGSKNKEVVLEPGNDYSHETLYFEWEDGDSGSGTSKYYIYFGPDPQQEPYKLSNLSNNSYEVVTEGFDTGRTYYLNMKTIDSVGNRAVHYRLYEYRYTDVTPPKIYTEKQIIIDNYTDFPVQAKKLSFGDIDDDRDLDVIVNNYYYVENIGTPMDSAWGEPVKDYYRLNLDDRQQSIAIYNHRIGGFTQDILICDSSIDFYLHQMYGTTYEYSQPFFTEQAFTKPYMNLTPVFGDIDGDGDKDLFLGNKEGSIIYVENTGVKDVGLYVGYEWLESNIIENYKGLSVDSYSYPSFMDIDNDGDYDLIVGQGNGTLTLFTNIGDKYSAEWGAPERNYLGIDVGTNSVPVTADLNLDGKPDLYVAGTTKMTASLNQNLTISMSDKTTTANSLDVEIDLYATDNSFISGYFLSNTSEAPEIQDSNWNIFKYYNEDTKDRPASFKRIAKLKNIPHRLADGPDGNRTINVWFRDIEGNISEMATLTISLDRTSTNNIN